MAITSRFVVDSQRLICPNLYYVDYLKWVNGSVVYDQEKCNFSYIGISKNLDNGYIALAAKYNIYIIDENSLKYVQMIVDDGPYNGRGFNYMSKYTDGEDTTILIKSE